MRLKASLSNFGNFLQKDGKKVLIRVGVYDILSKLSAGHGDAALKS